MKHIYTGISKRTHFVCIREPHLLTFSQDFLSSKDQCPKLDFYFSWRHYDFTTSISTLKLIAYPLQQGRARARALQPSFEPNFNPCKQRKRSNLFPQPNLPF
uniref:Uncharacterized protein n=1 Tax=Cucumis melo TaxID=3656 RepID=A0A9I9EFA1_CUCME